MRREKSDPTLISLSAAKYRRVFHPAQHRQPHLGDGGMGHFVKQHEQHVAGHEFREPLNIFWRKALKSRIAFAERKGRRVDPGLKFSRLAALCVASGGAGDWDGAAEGRAGCEKTGAVPNMSTRSCSHHPERGSAMPRVSKAGTSRRPYLIPVSASSSASANRCFSKLVARKLGGHNRQRLSFPQARTRSGLLVMLLNFLSAAAVAIRRTPGAN